MAVQREDDKHKRIQSVEVAFGILRVLAERRDAMTLSDLASATGLFKSQLYRYLNTFVHLGVLIRHEVETPRWSLGPELIALGGAAFDGIDLARHAAPQLIELRNRLNETVALSIWRERGPFFLRWEKSNKTVNVGVDTGSYVPLYTATGKVFRAFLPQSVTESYYQECVQNGTIDPAVYDPDVETVRQTRLAVTRGSIYPGVAAMSTPIFDANGELAGALSVIGWQGVLDVSRRSTAAQELLRTADEISSCLGYRRLTANHSG
ncbi:MAG: IclR family transcriptional regulator [Alicyclobacillus macrosporangiidus]|uniref:IclR family transcriptional regulator n=1 Tax=Alicyclobacillus macrosporangiidus TaxID=392015 RepID=UPI0026E9DBF7|nr:IclR family transcriptional regulator [Alicyclobacillus macrosporangiidus]MCL6601038.1 IclR family transcriptional regulator [Alicyclobacillus macrosporangiidus]